MAYTTKQIRAVRLLIPDTEAIYGDAENEYMFENEDIEIFLDEGYGNAKWAAGLASLAVGGSEALVLKWIRNYETQTNGAAVQKEWTAKGLALIAQGRLEIEAEGDDFFIIAHPEWGPQRHPEGMTHGAYRGVTPTPYQW